MLLVRDLQEEMDRSGWVTVGLTVYWPNLSGEEVSLCGKYSAHFSIVPGEDYCRWVDYGISNTFSEPAEHDDDGGTLSIAHVPEVFARFRERTLRGGELR